MNVLAIEGSTRLDSATNMALDRKLAEYQTASVRKVRLRDLQLPQFVDDRTDRNWQTSAELEDLLAAMVWADHIILASPLYWYMVSNLMKNFLDHWTYFLRHPRHPLKEVCQGKPFSLLVVGSGEESELTRPVLQALRFSVQYVHGKVVSQEYLTEADVRIE